MPLGCLAQLVATMPGWFSMMVEQDALDLNPPAGGGYKPPVTDTTAKLLAALDDTAAKGVAALRRTSDAHLATTWKVLRSRTPRITAGS